jgi:UDP-N-acetylmuramate dehydrogenase
MNLLKDYSLKLLNTFGIDVRAERFAEVRSREELGEFLKQHYRKEERLLVLGGGSNILFTKDFKGTVLKVSIGRISVIELAGDHVTVQAGAGTNWDSVVEYCVDHNWAGLENLSLIPGTAGSGPIQNIGAYGAEIADVISEVRCTEIATGREIRLTREDCRFGYRDSIFKHELRNKVIITEVNLKLIPFESPTASPHHHTTTPHGLKLDYGTIRQELADMGVTNPGIRDVREAVCRIRRSKLPDPAVTGNAGSFFKNPVVTSEKAASLQALFPDMPAFPDICGVKVPAAWLIEQCGWKGKVSGHAGVHASQPLVLVNLGQASGADILRLSEEVREAVSEKFGISLEPEVNII